MVNFIYCELNDGLESQLCLWCFDLLWLYVTVCHCLVDLLSGLEYWYVWYGGCSTGSVWTGAWSRGLDVLLLQKKPFVSNNTLFTYTYFDLIIQFRRYLERRRLKLDVWIFLGSCSYEH